MFQATENSVLKTLERSVVFCNWQARLRYFAEFKLAGGFASAKHLNTCIDAPYYRSLYACTYTCTVQHKNIYAWAEHFCTGTCVDVCVCVCP